MSLLIKIGKKSVVGRKTTMSPLVYGVEWNITNSNPSVTRIGNMELHATLPVQTQMQGCLLMDNGKINYYLKPDDWSKKADGTAANLDGTDGQVMIHIPTFFWKFETRGNFHRVLISKFSIPGYAQVPEMFISAFEATLNRTNNKLSSVVNTTAQYRGGNNNANWDEMPNTLLGRPATSITRNFFRTYARNRGLGWQMYFYQAHMVLWWLFVVEYATRNSQAAVDASLTPEGYRQGGLGDGVTTTDNTSWSSFSDSQPFISCGISNSLGNFTGEILTEIVNFEGDGVNKTFKVPRYRGLENPFGHIDKIVDGINIKNYIDSAGGETQVWISDDPLTWNDYGVVGYTNKGLISRKTGYINQIILGRNGEFIPKETRNNVSESTRYYCDYLISFTLTTDLTYLSVGGGAVSSIQAGLVYMSNLSYISTASSNKGTRLCYLDV